MFYIYAYFIFAIGFWCGAWIKDEKQPWQVPFVSLIRGFVGCLIWPVLIVMMARKPPAAGGNE